MNKRLYRSVKDNKISGVCGGIAEYFEMDSTIVRLIVAGAFFISFGMAVFIYLIAAIIIPTEPLDNSNHIKNNAIDAQVIPQDEKEEQENNSGIDLSEQDKKNE